MDFYLRYGKLYYSLFLLILFILIVYQFLLYQVPPVSQCSCASPEFSSANPGSDKFSLYNENLRAANIKDITVEIVNSEGIKG